MSRILIILSLLGASPVAAQTNAPEEDETAAEQQETATTAESQEIPEIQLTLADDMSSLNTRSIPDLKDEGFIFGEDANLSTSSTATLVALIAGLPLHGVGHLWIGDSRTATILFVSEGVSLAVMLVSGGFLLLDNHSSTTSGVAAQVFELGLSTFALSYLLDVVGTVQGNDRELNRNTRDDPGSFAEAGYGFFSTTQIPIRHILHVRSGLDFYNVYGELSADADVELNAVGGRLNIGGRFLRVNSQTFVFAEAHGEFFSFRDTGNFARTGLEVRLGGSWDLGGFLPQFRNLAVGAWAGFGRQFWHYGETFELSPDGHTDFLSHQLFVHFNATENLNLRLAHGTHPSWYIPSVNSVIGVTEAELLYATTFGRLRLSASVGSGLGVYLGGQVRF